MSSFISDGFEIAFLDEGEGEPIVLVHGFASNKEVNWAGPSWVTTLTQAGYRVIALDNRGHGGSAKPHDPAAYPSPVMAEDVRRLMDHLGIGRADVMGYSMGARITAFLARAHPDRVRSAVLGGIGIAMVEGIGGNEEIVAGLEAPSLDLVTDPRARAYRAFADQTKSDRFALAACMRAMRVKLTAELLSHITVPVLVAVGSKDQTAGSGRELAALIPGARFLDIVGRDHMPAVGDKIYKQGVLSFLEGRP